MKKMILNLWLAGIALGAFAADEPISIPSKLSELKSKQWYTDAYDRWFNYVSENETDEKGWLQLLRAARYSKVQMDDLEILIKNVDKAVPESSVASYAVFQLERWSPLGIDALSRALEKQSVEDLYLEEEILLEEFKLSGNRSNLSQGIFKKGLITRNTYNYAYNVLMSVGEDGILFTESSHTTIPLWVLQDQMNIRSDVEVINLELATNSDYLIRKFQKEEIDFEEERMLASLPRLNSERDFYYSLTLSNKNVEALQNELFVVGLASQQRSKRLNHYESLRTNLEDRFLLDYLTIDFDGESKTSTGNVLSQNYIVPFILLKEYYDETAQSLKAAEWEDQLIELAQKTNIEDKVLSILDGRESSAPTYAKVELPLKELEKRMVKVKGNIYASETEISNKEFWFFLDFLYKNGHQEEYEKFKADLTKYDEISRIGLSNFHYSPVNAKYMDSKYAKKKGNNNLQYPAMDLTYEAAVTYCNWLTQQYNTQEGRKFSKVEFRLPNKNEWEMAALGYSEFQSWTWEENTVKAQTGLKGEYVTYQLAKNEVQYPWFTRAWELRNSVKNKKNCYLANVKTKEEIVCPAGIKGDGWSMMSPVATYFSNGMGLYDVVGNVAEMINEEGIAMGGSWNHPSTESTIRSATEYDGPSAWVGFRVFMEVIEE